MELCLRTYQIIHELAAVDIIVGKNKNNRKLASTMYVLFDY